MLGRSISFANAWSFSFCLRAASLSARSRSLRARSCSLYARSCSWWARLSCLSARRWFETLNYDEIAASWQAGLSVPSFHTRSVLMFNTGVHTMIHLGDGAGAGEVPDLARLGCFDEWAQPVQ
jgi:hypothetical protein